MRVFTDVNCRLGVVACLSADVTDGTPEAGSGPKKKIAKKQLDGTSPCSARLRGSAAHCRGCLRLFLPHYHIFICLVPRRQLTSKVHHMTLLSQPFMVDVWDRVIIF